MEEFLKNFALVPRDVIAIPAMVLLFSTFWFLFKSNVIQRYLALFEARERASVGARQKAEENIAAAKTLEDDFERQLLQERVAIMKSLEPKMLEVKAEAARIIESAEAEAATLIDGTRKSISEELLKLSEVVERDADVLASSISERAIA